MAGKLVDEGENRILNQLFGSTSFDTTLYLGIYTAPTSEPPEDADLTDLTEPSSFGYARIALTRGSWTIVADAAGYAQQTFEASGGAWGNCYGYFICNVASGTAGQLLYVEQFSDGPYDVQDTDQIKITANIQVA